MGKLGKKCVKQPRKKRKEPRVSFRRVVNSTQRRDGWMDSVLEHTLEEDRHLNSFDKFMAKEKRCVLHMIFILFYLFIHEKNKKKINIISYLTGNCGLKNNSKHTYVLHTTVIAVLRHR